MKHYARMSSVMAMIILASFFFTRSCEGADTAAAAPAAAQMPAEIVGVAVEQAYASLVGKQVPKFILVPVRSVTKANADEFVK